ncbi:MAG: hypothetical protein ACTSVF_03980 [Candidatus Asgardarchaeia archaeon]
MDETELSIIKYIKEQDGAHIRQIYKKFKIDVKKLVDILDKLVSEGYLYFIDHTGFRYFMVTEKGEEALGKGKEDVVG